jgi:hypothetical protein
MRKIKIMCWMIPLALTCATYVSAVAAERSPQHETYAASLWTSLHPAGTAKYAAWTAATGGLATLPGPPSGPGAKTYLNAAAAAAPDKLPHGSIVVTEQLVAGADKPAAVIIRYRFQPGYHPASEDWYWAVFLPDGRVVRTVADKAPYDKPGFVTYLQDGRLWVFQLGSAPLAEYLTRGELGKRVTRPAGGPGGLTVMSDDYATLDSYVAAAEGLETRLQEGRIWVFRPRSPELAEFEVHGELAKCVTRPGAGPRGMTVKAADAETLDAYLRQAGKN